MTDTPFNQLELSDVANLVERINPIFDGEITFDPVDTVILAKNLSFYPNYQMLHISDQGITPPSMRYVVESGDDMIVMDYTNKPIYEANKDIPIVLSDETIIDYVRFFFTYVKGRHGRFLLVENVDDISCKEEPPPSARSAIGKMLSPIEILGQEGGIYHLTAKMIFKDSLFKSDIYIDAHGTVTLKDEELLIEDMPVLDDIFGE